MTQKIGLIFIAAVAVGGCARDGNFSKEGAYEMMRGINKMHNPSIESSDQPEMRYREYERLRDEQLLKKSNDEMN